MRRHERRQRGVWRARPGRGIEEQTRAERSERTSRVCYETHAMQAGRSRTARARAACARLSACDRGRGRRWQRASLMCEWLCLSCGAVCLFVAEPL